jgi:uncharacterized FlgJ-related protein
MNLLLVLAIATSETSVRTRVVHLIQRDTIKIDPMPLTDSAITAELVKLGCVLPNVALAQFKIESGHFKSAICRENFNLAGIKTSRSEYVIGKNRDHCVYRSYRDCLKDYVRIQNRYLKNIDGKYAAPGKYVERLTQVR